MKVSTKGRYGLRAMIDLAVHAKGDHVALYSIAEKQGVSMNYLEQVFSILRKSGFVKSVKGAQGGYILAEAPIDIKIGTILRALEGPLSVIDENTDKSKGNETRIQHCIRIHVWNKMNESLKQLVDSLTLEDLADNYRKMSGMEDTMYYI